MPGSSFLGILQERILGWVASSFRGSSLPRNRTHTSCIFCIAGRFFTSGLFAEFSKFADTLIKSSNLTASSFRIWNSSTGIPSPPLALSWCFLRPIWLHISGCLLQVTDHTFVVIIKAFFWSSSAHSCHLFVRSSVSARSLPFLSFILPIFAWKVPLISPVFLKRSLVFPVLLKKPSYMNNAKKCEHIKCILNPNWEHSVNSFSK